MPTRREFVGTLAAAALPALFHSPFAVAGESALIKQLTVVVGFPPGGGTDIIARLVSDSIRGKYAETVIVENKAGAGGRIGADYVKNRPADGSFLLFTPAFPMIIYPHVYKNMTYDTLKDFTPVAMTHRGIMAFAVGPAVPAQVRTVQDYVAWAREHPEKSNFGAPAGSSQHFAGAQFARSAKINLQLVQYKGGAPAIVDCLGGHIAAVVAPLSETAPQRSEGKLRVLATTGGKRSPAMPDVPTMAESGYADVLFQDWSGFLGPAGMPPERTARLNALVNEAVRTPRIAETMMKLGSPPDTLAPEAFRNEIREGWSKYQKIVKAVNFVAQD
ncbi:MAG: tripartite tricarboxylate transporter substrate-binding protein [Pigmentiphaga sp.]|uniref:tripartite tricarboxylate transporter substrate-binding protein n=1 Tax=Pigmentiphaga sp. TaxID=1977564 RepID=UPI0029A253FB|nr:tripartite tricarboxylate transporter substrate-binding protein [Pigmentiphaga sp.]MDX3906323.1 tripartite tricarboxylate transporter substrate-binding protein [Pigmentiphaga sp.]